MELAVCPEQASSLQDAIALMQKRSFDLVVADYKPSDCNWSQILKSVNGACPGLAVIVLVENGQEPKTIPVTFFVANRKELDSIHALHLSADTDQSGLPEMLSQMRVKPLQPSSDKEPDVIEENGLRFDGRTQEVTVRGRVVPLSVLEFKLLRFLASHPHQIFNRHRLLAEVWKQGRVVNPRTVDVHMRRLREKIEKLPDKPSYLLTVRGAGYRFVPQNDKKVA